jgi:hypothetical protein
MFSGADLTFDGTVSISFTMLNSSSSVWLNFEKLNINSIVLKEGEQTELIDAFEYNLEISQVKVTALNWFQKGNNYTLTIEYDGKLSDTNHGGFFYYTYKLEDKKTE